MHYTVPNRPVTVISVLISYPLVWGVGIAGLAMMLFAIP
jgi:hypothetical protein